MILLNIIPFGVLILVNSLISVLSRKKFGKSLPLTMMLVVLVLYLSQIIGDTFNYGLILLALAAAGGIGVIALSVKRKENRSLLWSNGFWVFLAIFILYFIMSYKRQLFQWDELMHWGKMVKQMLRLDRFYFVPESTLMYHKDYPPFISLFEYFWCRLSGGYSDMGMLMSIHVFQLSIVVPFLLEHVDIGQKIWDRLIRGGMIVLIYVVLLFYLDEYGTFETIYTDILVGLIFAYSMGLVFSRDAVRDAWGCTAYALTLFALINVKQIGMAFVLASVFYYAVILLRENGSVFRKTLMLLFPVLLCAGSYLIWNRLIASHGITGQFNIKDLSLGRFFEVLKGSGAEHDTIVRFYRALFTRNITSGFLPITYASSILVAVLIAELLHRADREAFSRFDKNLTVFTLVIGSLGYALVMMILYAFPFTYTDPNEAQILSSYTRYMGSWFTGELVFLSFIAMRVFRNRIGKLGTNGFLIVMLGTMVLFNPMNLRKMVPHFTNEKPTEHYKVRADKITECTEPGSRVYIAYTQTWGSSDQVFISYFADDVYIDGNFADVLNTDYEKNPEALKRDIDLLKQDDYLYTQDVTESFNRAFAKYNQGQDLVRDQVYKISGQGENFQLEMVSDKQER